MIQITPLDGWIRRKVQIGHTVSDRLFLKLLEDYHLRKLNEAINYARNKTAFYRHHLALFPERPLSTLSDLAALPFTNSSDISEKTNTFLAVRQDDIARIVTLLTSGSTGPSKRIFFTEEDLELTVDFFHHGMSTLVKPGWRVAILLPGELPDSVGDLLKRGLERMGVQSLICGPVKDPVHVAENIKSFEARCIVGIPTQVLSIVRSEVGASIGRGVIQSVLLSTDYVPRVIIKAIENVWGCRVFNHYGMTETGLGGGVECEALDGYHLREADLYFEIVNPETGKICHNGERGEVVFTTLTRHGMPLIRYRTGDISRIIGTPCPCGSILKRMETVKGRWKGSVRVSPDHVLSLPEMDEILFALPDLLDYRAVLSKGTSHRWCLRVYVYRTEGGKSTESDVIRALSLIRTIGEGVASGYLETPRVQFSAKGQWKTTGVSKRTLVVSEDGPV